MKTCQRNRKKMLEIWKTLPSLFLSLSFYYNGVGQFALLPQHRNFPPALAKISLSPICSFFLLFSFVYLFLSINPYVYISFVFLFLFVLSNTVELSILFTHILHPAFFLSSISLWFSLSLSLSLGFCSYL